MSQTGASLALKRQTALVYRRAVLLERVEQICHTHSDWQLLWWELRELEKALPNLARTV